MPHCRQYGPATAGRDTQGGKLLESHDEEATFFFDALDYNAPIRASIDQFDLSGHADRSELLQSAEQTEARAIILTHGDQDARDWFQAQLKKRLPNTQVIDPEPLLEYEV
jgi:Cft2 family RNA processing exonuclease